MSLSLNLAYEGDCYREFSGQNRAQMPILLASGRVPLSTKGLMERRIAVRAENFGSQYKGTAHEASVHAVRDAIWTNYVDTGDGVIYHPNGNIRVVTDAAFLRALTADTRLQNGAVVLSDEMYKQLTEAPEFTRDQVQRDRFGTVWLALARDDKALLDGYRQAVKQELKARHNYEGENMNVWLANAQNVTTGRLWCVSGSSDYSIAGGDYDLGIGGRLFGVAPEAQSVVARSASPEQALPELEVVVARVYGHLQGRTDPVTEDSLREVLRPLYKQ